MQYAVLVMLPLTTIEALLPSFHNNPEGQILCQKSKTTLKVTNPLILVATNLLLISQVVI
jgi:hypothetical protein